MGKPAIPPVEKQDFVSALLDVRADVLQTMSAPVKAGYVKVEKVETPDKSKSGYVKVETPPLGGEQNTIEPESEPGAEHHEQAKGGLPHSAEEPGTSNVKPSLALPISVVEPGLLTVAQCVKVRIEHNEELISENTYDHWGVVIFNPFRSGNFELEVTMLADAPYTDPWHNWMVVGAVPSGTSAQHLSNVECPYYWGTFLTPFTEPLEIWSGSRGTANHSSQCHSVPHRLLSGQKLRLCNNAGRMSFGVDMLPPQPLPSNFQRKEQMLPCLILGLKTRVVVSRLSTEREHA